jgi:hypothetical protein
MQSSPVLSSKGFCGVGIESAHCHHSAVSAGKRSGGTAGGLSANAGCAGIISPITIPTIAKLGLLITSSLSGEKSHTFDRGSGVDRPGRPGAPSSRHRKEVGHLDCAPVTEDIEDALEMDRMRPWREW